MAPNASSGHRPGQIIQLAYCVSFRSQSHYI